MIEITGLEDLTRLVESVELECKLAAGQDGRGKLPDDFWATYSAFANTHGGLVILGVKERQGWGASNCAGCSSEHSGPSSEHSPEPSGGRDANGCLLSALLDAPIVDDLSLLTPTLPRGAGKARHRAAREEAPTAGDDAGHHPGRVSGSVPDPSGGAAHV